VPVNLCIECGGEFRTIYLNWHGTCSTICDRARQKKANRRQHLQWQTERRLLMGQAPRRLLRDLDGYVHSPSGFLSAKRYDRVRAEHPDRNFPERETIPLMSDLSDDDLNRWYTDGGNVSHA
jgi:hypothetical protein